METLQTKTKKAQSDLEQEIAGLDPWFHNLHLPGGTLTAKGHPLGDFPKFKWDGIEPHLPRDMSGWTALDVGCNAGFYSFELASRGAQVTAIEPHPHYLKQARWAAEKFDLRDRIDFQQRQVYDLLREEQSYDIVWFMGVFYHLRYPLLALDMLAGLCDKLMVFQTLQIPEKDDANSPDDPEIPVNVEFSDRRLLAESHWPKLAFIEHNLAGDPTNWWVGDSKIITALLHSAGLEVLQKPEEEVYVCEPRHSEPPNQNAGEQLRRLRELARG
jgi:tRNA (mo5U34)-methyltransferase